VVVAEIADDLHARIELEKRPDVAHVGRFGMGWKHEIERTAVQHRLQLGAQLAPSVRHPGVDQHRRLAADQQIAGIVIVQDLGGLLNLETAAKPEGARGDLARQGFDPFRELRLQHASPCRFERL
jgi:hypothetical protein